VPWLRSGAARIPDNGPLATLLLACLLQGLLKRGLDGPRARLALPLVSDLTWSNGCLFYCLALAAWLALWMETLLAQQLH